MKYINDPNMLNAWIVVDVLVGVIGGIMRIDPAITIFTWMIITIYTIDQLPTY